MWDEHMSTVDHNRYFLTLLIWTLILEIIVIAYYARNSMYDRFEFGLTLFMTFLTVIGIVFIIRSIRREL